MKKLAMIGCGGIGGYHLKHFLSYDDIELAGFCDLIPERAESFAQKAGGSAFVRYGDMLDSVKPDMVFVCVPPTAHGAIEMELIDRRIPFFVEKPVSLDLDLARRIRDEAAKAGVITASGFQCRYSSLVQPTREFVDSHPAVLVSCTRVGGVPAVEWWRKRATSGGQIVEQTIHQFDLIRYMLGEPETVFTMGARGFVTGVEGYDTEDVSVTAVRFASGALATIATGCYAEGAEASDSKITFGARDARLDHYILSKVKLFADAGESGEGLVFKGDGTLAAGGGAHRVYEDDGLAGVRCDRTFVDAVLTGDASAIRSPYADAVRSLAFTLACNESMDTGKPIDVDLG
ncbi:MAG: Gfo/Idh/MocA family oxidoreductase [Clostridiales bacterium]|nr:Gfo/Idh/MocA family oxidoreductase [Clostridiales bacterium]